MNVHMFGIYCMCFLVCMHVCTWTSACSKLTWAVFIGHFSPDLLPQGRSRNLALRSALKVRRRVTALRTLTNWGKCRKRLWKYFTEFPFPSQHVQTLVDCSIASQPSQASGLDSCVVSFFTCLPAQFKCYIPRNLSGAEQSPCSLRLKSEHLTCGTYGPPCWCWRKAASQEANHET